MNKLDNLINYFSPSWGLKRQRAKLALHMLRKYEAASTASRVSTWSANGTSADAEVLPALLRLIYRSRDMIRNEPLATRAQMAVVSHICGSGIIAQARGNSARAKELNYYWNKWAEKKCCDVDEINNIYGLQMLALNTWFESGNCFVKRIWKKGSLIPIELQVLEPDYLDLARTQDLENGNYVKQGIEFNHDGKRVAYWMFKQHPGEYNNITINKLTSVRIPASEILHMFFRKRPGQNFGVPCLHSVMMTIKDFGEFEDATLIRQKVAACFTAFIHDVEVPEDVATGKIRVMDKIEPGRIEVLPQGKGISFSNPPAVSGYAEYSKSQKQKVACGLGLTYEALTADLSNVNFSSGRLGRLDMDRIMSQYQWQMMIPMFCEKVWNWFEEAADTAGLLPQQDDTVEVEHTPPKRDIVDISGETEAYKEMVRCGFQTQSEVIRQFGYDPDKFYEDYANDLTKLDKYKIKLDTDVRQDQQKNQQQISEKEIDTENTETTNKGGDKTEVI